MQFDTWMSSRTTPKPAAASSQPNDRHSRLAASTANADARAYPQAHWTAARLDRARRQGLVARRIAARATCLTVAEMGDGRIRLPSASSPC
jgi:hypothetical protein